MRLEFVQLQSQVIFPPKRTDRLCNGSLVGWGTGSFLSAGKGGRDVRMEVVQLQSQVIFPPKRTDRLCNALGLL